MKKFLGITVFVFAASILYLLTWPVLIDPAAWTAPPNPGYSGPFAVNNRLAGIEKLPLAGCHGPEDIALDSKGHVVHDLQVLQQPVELMSA